MGLLTFIQNRLHQRHIHPRRWLKGLVAYSRYVGYVQPALLTDSAEEYQVRRQLVAPGWGCRQLTAPVGKRLLVLSPHPDDESIGPGGLLWAHRASAEIHLVTFSQGDAGGSLGAGESDMTAVRRAELSRTAQALGARSTHSFAYRDGQIPVTAAAVADVRAVVERIQPDVVLLPWFLDNHMDHSRVNLLYATACPDREALVLGYEVWRMLEPNAVFDITPHLAGKLDLVRNYPSQLRTVDYLSYVEGLARVRAYHAGIDARRSGAMEAFVALPNQEYCELVRRLYGTPEQLTPTGRRLMGLGLS